MEITILIYLMVFMPMAGALVSYLIGRRSKKARDYFVSAITILEFILAVALVAMDAGHEGMLVCVPEICGMGLCFTIDGFRVSY